MSASIRHQLPQFYAWRPTTKSFIRIPYGEVGGGYPSDIESQRTADELNRKSGWTPEHVEAAVCCAMHDCWENFAKLVDFFKEEDELWSRKGGKR